MKNVRKIVWLIIMSVLFSFDTYSQAEDNFKRLQDLSIEQIHNKGIKQKKKANSSSQLGHQQEQIELDVNDSIFKLFDVDIDLTLGEISLDTSWGDPVKNPKIRRNRASNLFGPVRHNADGSIRWHRGFDYYAPKGTPIYSVGNGVVALVQNHPDFGHCVLVTHKRPKQTYYSFYAHLSSYAPGISIGDYVTSDQYLGYMGDTGYSFGVHLHLEIFPCRLNNFDDPNCYDLNSFIAYGTQLLRNGYKGPRGLIYFPTGTYNSWNSR